MNAWDVCQEKAALGSRPVDLTVYWCADIGAGCFGGAMLPDKACLASLLQVTREAPVHGTYTVLHVTIAGQKTCARVCHRSLSPLDFVATHHLSMTPYHSQDFIPAPE